MTAEMIDRQPSAALAAALRLIPPDRLGLVDDQTDLEADLDAFGDPDWQARGLCAQTDPEAFFPEKGGSTREAKRICSACEVRSEV